MRAMILAAGLGTRLRPLTNLRAKPALPVRGRPVISLLLEMLARHGVRDVMVNLHHLPATIRSAVERDRPAESRITWSREERPLGTGGGIRRAADYLRESDDCLVLAGDMLLDLDLGDLLGRHRASGRDVTLVLRDDPRGRRFGTIGIDADGTVTRIGKAASDGTEIRSALFTGVRFFARDALTDWPDAEAFEDLRDWIWPMTRARRERLGAEILSARSCVWEPVGTHDEYLAANFSPPDLSYLDVESAASAIGVHLEPELVIGAGATIAPGASLRRVVVWDGEHVPDGTRAREGTFAGGRFHPSRPEPSDGRGDDPISS